ncbi:MAG: polysaccharide pyruvyl transferase family protein [Desulfosalsimonas sp.]
MLIEIRKTQFVNKGAELMLYSVLQKMKEAFPGAGFVMAPGTYNSSAPYQKRAELGLFQKAWLWRYRIPWGDLAGLAPKKVREMYGVVLDKEINIVIDASGFSYSDQWGIGATRELARASRRWRKQGTKVILVPQAMGPFTSPKIKKYIRSAADNVDLMFPRDPISYRHLIEVVGARPNIKMAPDFTNLIQGILPDYFDPDKNRFCMVPNYRMIDKTPREQSKAYTPFMIQCARYLLEKDQKPFVLVHEGENDMMLARQIAEGAGGDLPIIRESQPLKIKGILGACQGTIGSRFHGLVSALSQGVPSLATGWSHKYRMLFNDYGFEDGLLDVMEEDEEIRRKIDLIIEPVSRPEIQEEITARSNELKKQAEEMWNTIFEVLGVK